MKWGFPYLYLLEERFQDYYQTVRKVITLFNIAFEPEGVCKIMWTIYQWYHVTYIGVVYLQPHRYQIIFINNNNCLQRRLKVQHTSTTIILWRDISVWRRPINYIIIIIGGMIYEPPLKNILRYIMFTKRLKC